MKDIKKAYDEIEISDREKNKIFNNIMENRKKSFNWGPVFGFGAIALASVGLFMILGKNPVEPITTGGGENQLVGRNIQLENSYRKEIIINAQNYLQSNEIDLEEIEDGQELVIEGEKIVDNEEFQGCKGNLVIKRFSEDFSYSTNVTCDGDDRQTDQERKYVIYSGTLTNVFEVDDYIAVASRLREKKVGYQVVNCDANLTLIDKEGNVVFNKLIKSVYKDEDSTVEVKEVNKIGDKYYLVLELDNDIHFQPSGAGSLRAHSYLMVLDKDGNELSYKELIDENNNQMTIDKFIGGENGTIYYIGSIMNRLTYDYKNVIIKVTENDMDTVEYTVSEDSSRKDVATHYVITDYENGYFYGYKYDKSYAGKYYYAANEVFKMNENGEIVWTANVDGNILKVHVDDQIYVLTSMSNYKLYEFNTDGEENGVSVLGDFSWIEDFYFDGDDIIFKGTRDEEHFFEIYNKKLEMEEKIVIDNSDITEKYEWHYMRYWKLNNHRITAGYMVEETLEANDSVLLVFNK